MLRLHVSCCNLVIFAVLISGCVVVPTYKARITLTPTIQNNQELQIRRVLLIGTGSSASGIFLDNLSAEMIRSLGSKDIRSAFKYIGKVPQSTTLKIDSLKEDIYDSYLVFNAANDLYLDMTKAKFTAIGPGATVTGYGNQFKETYTVTLYNGGQKEQILWQGELAVDFDIVNSSRYKQISQLILNELAKNRIL